MGSYWIFCCLLVNLQDTSYSLTWVVVDCVGMMVTPTNKCQEGEESHCVCQAIGPETMECLPSCTIKL